MTKSLVQECQLLLISGSYQNLEICHFCIIYSVHLLSMSSTCVLCYIMPYLQGCMPCIFVINVVTRTSMQTRLRDVADFSPCSAVIFIPCKLDATERSMHILRYFSKDVLNIWLFSIHSCPWFHLWSSLACHFRALLLLQNVSSKIVYMLFNLAKLVVVDLCMLWTCSCLGWLHRHVFLLMLCLSCHAMTCGECFELVKQGT